MAGYDISSPFQEGVLVGRYQLLGSIGRGGMGEVWRALDTSLARVVALKVFPVGLAATPQRRARFEREARAAAAVSHPNLVGIFDVGEFEGLPYLVQEFVDGETIEAMLDRAPVPVRRAVAWAIQAAEGLAHAHDAGILHRDIKPGNLMVGRDGRVRVLDFGLAKLQDPPEDRTEKDGVREENLTTEGLVLGTAHYMSPEQAMGRKLDGRSDVFSLGICLFEMIAGERPFQGASAIDVMHAIISKPAKTLPATVRSVPPALHGVLDKALQKDPANRYAGMREFVRALAQVLQEAPDSDPLGDALTPSLGAPVVPRPWSSGREAAYTERLPVTVTGELRRPYLRVAVAFGALLVLASAVFALSRRPSGAEPLKPAQITASDGLDLFPALSHDGKTVVYASDKTGRFEIYRRALEISSREIQLTDDGQQNVSPALSPSGEFVAYHSKIAGGIWIVPSLGGVPRQLTPFGARPVWSPDGKLIAFQSAAILDLAANSPGALPPSTLWIVDAAGGEPRAVTKPVAPPGGHGAPCFSPDGKRLAFSSYNRVSADVYLVNLDGSDLIALTSGSGFRYDPVFVEEGEAVVYSYFDSSWNSSIQKLRITKSGKARGPAETLSNLGFGAMKHLAYAPGASLLAYSAQSIQSNIWSVPVDGATFGAAGPAKPLTRENGRNTRPVFSGDGSRIALTKWRLGATQDIWFIDPDGKNPTQRTNNPEDDDYAQWMPDGKRLAFASRRVDRRLTMWVQDLASGKEELLADPGPEVDGLRLSQDGKLLAFNSTRGGSAINTWLLPIGAREPRALTNDPEMMGFPVFTPDGEAVVLEHKRGNDAQLVLVPVAGGEPRTLTQGPGQSWPWSISSDGLRVFYAGLREGVWNIYSIPLEGGAEVPLTKLEKLNAYVRYPAVSPDGKTVVYEQAETTGNIWILEGVK